MLCDGMADEPNAQLDNSTPMAKAVKPCMDYLASKGEVGMVKTVAEGLKPGSDVANLSVLGYEPAVYYSGRSPLEAASIGIDLKDTDVTLRCNLVTLSDEENYEDKSMVDYCAGDISTEEVQQKAKAALEYCHNATEFTTKNNGKPWKYLLLPHNSVSINYDFNYYVKTYEYK